MYYTYAPSNKDLERAFDPPEKFMTGRLLDSMTLGYKDDAEMATMLDQYRFNRALDLGQQSKRVNQAKRNLRQSPAQVGEAGFGPKTSISSVAAEGYKGSKDTAKQVGEDLTPPKKRTPRGLR
jgi:hypothetical protein